MFAAFTVGVVPVPGCVTDACPAVGYVSTLTVHLEGNVAAVSEVRLCDDTGCSQPAPVPGTPVPKRTILPTFSPDIQPSPAPPASFPPFHGQQQDSDTWVFTLNLGTPSDVTVRAVAADGTVLAEQDHELVWTRVGGSERCGGPMSTPPILVSVP
ncbi:hypothetical protein CXX84_03790 [Arthrobacter sp. AFG7.2]|nr:hypothetical protein CXX84_03790 [Arthrobacter sp. AFG7.2]